MHLSAEQYERWRAAAESSGDSSLSEYVKRAVEDRIAGRSVGNLSAHVADKVLVRLLPEMERVLLAQAAGSPPPYVDERDPSAEGPLPRLSGGVTPASGDV